MNTDVFIAPPRSVFASEYDDLFATYDVSLTFTDRLMGGVPMDAKQIEGWIRAKAGITNEEEILALLATNLIEVGVEVDENWTVDQLREASEKVAASKMLVGFYRNPEFGLYIPARYVKAMIKECTNILFAGEKWGPTRKGPKSFVAERVFVGPRNLYLDRAEPDGVYESISHLTGPKGPYSALNRNEFVERASVDFSLRVLNDCISELQWRSIWILAEDNGLGAMRSQGFGCFVVTRFERRD